MPHRGPNVKRQEPRNRRGGDRTRCRAPWLQQKPWRGPPSFAHYRHTPTATRTTRCNALPGPASPKAPRRPVREVAPFAAEPTPSGWGVATPRHKAGISRFATVGVEPLFDDVGRRRTAARGCGSHRKTCSAPDSPLFALRCLHPASRPSLYAPSSTPSASCILHPALRSSHHALCPSHPASHSLPSALRSTPHAHFTIEIVDRKAVRRLGQWSDRLYPKRRRGRCLRETDRLNATPTPLRAQTIRPGRRRDQIFVRHTVELLPLLQEGCCVVRRLPHAGPWSGRQEYPRHQPSPCAAVGRLPLSHLSPPLTRMTEHGYTHTKMGK